MRFGVLCNGPIFQRWQLEAIQHLVAGGHTCELLLVNANQPVAPGFVEKLVKYPYSKLLVRLWFRYLMKPAAKELADISGLNLVVPRISCFTFKKGYAEYFNEADLATIKSFKLDFILRFGFSILKGEILDSAKYGIWSYHHDDDRKYRGVPTGFWEIMFGDPVNAAILQRLTSKLDSGVILHKAYFSTIFHSWEANFNNLLQSSTEWPLQVCTKIESGDTAFLSVTNAPQSPVYKLPGNLKMLRFLSKLLYYKARFQFRDLFITEKWNVGIIEKPTGSFFKPGEMILPEPRWLELKTKRYQYHADSFGFARDGYIYIICEEYDYKRSKGILVSLQLDIHSLELIRRTVALELGYHLAYPFLFEHQGTYYCIPENSEGGKVDLYIFDPDSGKLIFEQTLVENLQAVDPSVCFYNGFWWLFFTDRTSTNERLHIWFSSDLKGEYTPHANNPVKVDVRSSRPAGNPFVIDRQLYRPAQDCSARSGRRIAVNKVIALSPRVFDEEVYTIINPSPKSEWNDGMHTISVSENSIIVDGKKECFIWPAFTHKIKLKVKRKIKSAK